RAATQYLVQRVVILLIIFSAAVSAQNGVVKFAGQPVPGATVIASQGSTRVLTTTDESGQYDFQNLPPGAYSVEVQMVGFQPARRQVQIGATPQATEWTLELQPRPAQQAQRNQPAQQAGFRNVAQDESEPDSLSGQLPPLDGAARSENSSE